MEEQIQQLQRRVNEQILERAEADPQWRQQFVEDPQTAVGGIPEARQLEEMHESARPTEQQSPEATMPATPPPGEEYWQLHRSLTQKILDRAASDPAWKQQLLDDPEAAVREANFPESQRLEEMLQEEEEAEVRGLFDLGAVITDHQLEQDCYNHCNWGNGYMTYWSY